MKIERIELHEIALPLVHPFRTSFGEETHHPAILVAVHSEGLIGWAECVSSLGPFYSAETIRTSWHILTDFLIPLTLGKEVSSPADLVKLIKPVRGLPITCAAIENAVWDLLAKAQGVSLREMIAGYGVDAPRPVRDRVEVGVSIGIQTSIDALVERVGRFVDLGYNRIKCKIEPGWTVEPLKRIRDTFPNMRVMADANSAFTLDDVDMLRELDALGLLMIEQPLAYNDIADHARLQTQIATPVCLDESIHSVADAQAMIDLNAGRIINMKVARVGGLTNAITIHDMAQAAGIEMWCGGMLETGIGRSVNVQLASLPNFTLPGDISATARYFHEDIADPPFILNAEDSTMSMPSGPGIGVTVMMDRVKQATLRHYVAKA